ncbi:MAG: Rne/Rng family ribonuclease [Pseudomonadota bacterium]
MPKKMLIDATHAEETRVVVVDGNKVEEFDFESENRRQLAGNIYLAKVTRVEPSLQAAFVEYGGNRHGFLAFSEIHPDYYQIPVADRQALLEEEQAYAQALAAKEDEEQKPKRRSTRSRSKSKAAGARTSDAKTSKEIEGMETLDLEADEEDLSLVDEEGSSPIDRVADTPVETPESAVTEDTTDAKGAERSEVSGDAKTQEQAASDDADDQAENDAVGDAVNAAQDDDDEDAPKSKKQDAAAKDDTIESVADDDDSDDIRLPRKPRPRRYKIQEVIKVRQILLVQVVKEERGNKGAALTTYLSLAGRYCVLMPNTARGGGISRKITNAADRKKLKEIAGEIKVPQGAGLIVRTAGAKRTRAEIKRDYEYLQRLWEQIRELTLKSIAPAKIYEEGDLIKRSIRDLYNREIDEVYVEGERGYRIAKDFMKMIMPSHAKNVKRYEEALPLFARYQVEGYLAGMFNPTVQLPSGGYIVIGVTEALVAIDVNSGRATKEGSIEQTATKTNLEAAAEVARQLRLRDLAGLIVIDFIDMDERRNNAAVEKMMKEKLKTDRARIQVGRISGFGLMEMSRQRLRPGMIEATTQPCPVCHGTGLIRSDDSLALSIIRQMEEEGTRRRSREVLVKAPVQIANFLMNAKREHVAQIEARYGMAVRIEGDPQLVSPDFSMEKFKTATRNVSQIGDGAVSVDSSIMEEVDQAESAEAEEEDTATPNEDTDGKPKRRRRRRRSRGGRGKNRDGENGPGDTQETSDPRSDDEPLAPDDTAAAVEEVSSDDETVKPAPKRRSRSKKATEDPVATPPAAASEADAPDAPAEDKPAKPKRTRSRKPKKSDEAGTDAPVSADEGAKPADEALQANVASETQDAPPEEKAAVKPKRSRKPKQKEPSVSRADAPPEAPAAPADPAPVAEAAGVVEQVAEKPSEPEKPKRKGWWSLGR